MLMPSEIVNTIAITLKPLFAKCANRTIRVAIANKARKQDRLNHFLK